MQGPFTPKVMYLTPGSLINWHVSENQIRISKGSIDIYWPGDKWIQKPDFDNSMEIDCPDEIRNKEPDYTF